MVHESTPIAALRLCHIFSSHNFTLGEIFYVALPKVVDAPNMPTLNELFLMFTRDILYIHHSLSFAIRTAKAAAKVKKGVYRHHKSRDSPPRPN